MQHDFSIILGHIQDINPDLTDISWPDAEHIYFKDGSSFIQNGIKYAGGAVMFLDYIIWAIALPPETSAQKTELTALTQALKLTKGAIATVDMPLLWLTYMGHIPREGTVEC